MPRSPALSEFLAAIGRVQYHVYTCIVGLSAVEAGTATKPVDLDISWETKNPVGSAREARAFGLSAALVFSAEITSEYVRKYLRYAALEDGVQQHVAARREIAGRCALRFVVAQTAGAGNEDHGGGDHA